MNQDSGAGANASMGEGARAMIFRGEGFVLRPLELADAPALYVAHSDPIVHHYWAGPPHASLAETEKFVAETIAMPGAQAWAITEGGGEALGRVALFQRQKGVGEFGIVMRRKAQGKGLARKAVARVAEHAFEAGFHRLFADVDPENAASIRLFERCGFAREALLKANWITHMGVRDTLIYARLKPGLVLSEP